MTSEITLNTIIMKDFNALEFLPQDKMSPQICYAAIQKSGHVFYHIPEDK